MNWSGFEVIKCSKFSKKKIDSLLLEIETQDKKIWIKGIRGIVNFDDFKCN